jgi:hypothetical protein
VNLNLNQVRKERKIFDLEVVAFSIITEFMSINSENSLFKVIDKRQIPNLIERSQFNKRRRKLFLFSEEVRTKLAVQYLCFEDIQFKNFYSK